MVALGDRAQIERLLIGHRLDRDHLGGHAMHGVAHSRGRAGRAEFLRDQGQGQQARATAAEPVGHVQAHQSGRGQGAERVFRPDGLAVDALGLRSQSGARDLGGRAPQSAKWRGEIVEIHRGEPSAVFPALRTLRSTGTVRHAQARPS